MPAPRPGALCLRCRYPLDPQERAVRFAQQPPIVDAVLCPSCGDWAPGPAPPAFPWRTSRTEYRLFDPDEGETGGFAITVDPRENRAQVALWEGNLVQRVLRTMPYRTLLERVLVVGRPKK
jgi:hypothetical protein